MKTIDVLHLPKSLWLGRRGENNFRPVSIEWGEWHTDYPDATLSVIYHRPDGQNFIVATGTTSPIIWIPQQDTTTVSGVGELEMHLVGDPEIGISAHVDTIVDDSRSNASVVDAPAWVDKVVQDVAAEADRAEAAAESIGTQIDEAVAEAVPSAVADYIEEHPIEVEETDPTVPAWAKQPTKPTYTASEVGALPDSYTPPVVSVNGQTGAVNLGASDVGAYVKPSGGIPKTDLAEDVQTSLGKADTALQQHQSLSGYATETYVQQQIAAIPDELPSVSASDNGKVLGVVNGAWAAKADEGGGGGSAPFEIPITQSGSTYTTTATAEEILDHADNCVVNVNGSLIANETNTVQGTTAILTFSSTDSMNGYLQNSMFMVTVRNGSVSVAVYNARADALPAVTSDDNGKSLVVENGVWGKGYQAARIPRVAMASTDTTPTLDQNKLYVFPEMASLAITLATPSDNTIVNEYHFMFTSGATATTLTLPATILQPDGFTVEANHVYEISILENCMTAQGWAVSA